MDIIDKARLKNAVQTYSQTSVLTAFLTFRSWYDYRTPNHTLDLCKGEYGQAQHHFLILVSPGSGDSKRKTSQHPAWK